MIKTAIYSLGLSALLATSVSAGEPIKVRGIQGGMSIHELTAALSEIDDFVYVIETNDRFPCENAPQVTVFDKSIKQSVEGFYKNPIEFTDKSNTDEKFLGCFERNIYGPSSKHAVATFSFDSVGSKKLFSSDYKCEFINGCFRNINDLAKDFLQSQSANIRLREYPKSPDGVVFQGVTADGEGVGIRQNGSILIISADSIFLSEKDPNKPTFD